MVRQYRPVVGTSGDSELGVIAIVEQLVSFSRAGSSTAYRSSSTNSGVVRIIKRWSKLTLCSLKVAGGQQVGHHHEQRRIARPGAVLRSRQQCVLPEP
jgi:hypothetical protein